MRTVNGNRPCIPIGHLKDNESLCVTFNITKFYKACGEGGTFEVRHKRAIDPDGYPIPSSRVSLDGVVLTWVVNDADLVTGEGLLQIKYSIDGVVMMSEEHMTICKDSLGRSAEPPDAWVSYIDEVEENARKAEEAVTHYPYIDLQTQTWWVWDVATEQFIDTGVGTGGGGGTPYWSSIKNKPFEAIDTQTLVVNSGVLAVNTTNDVENGGAKPVTAAGVNVVVGNINVLLSQI